jgi:glycosyltransferase involved in cell wall biosynthesis
MMHIVQIIDSLDWGGAQKLQVIFANEVRSKDVILTIISLQDNDSSTSIHADLSAAGAELIFLPARRILNTKRLQRIYQIIRHRKVDLIHTHLTFANILGALVGWLTNTPVISTLHSERFDHIDPRWQRMEEWALRNGTRKVIAVGQSVITGHQGRLGAKEMLLVPNAVPEFSAITLEKKKSIRRELVAESESILLISVGRLSPPKGYFDLLSAFKRVARKHPNTHLMIVGGGDLFADLSAEIDSCGMVGRVHLLGQRNDVPELLMASDIYVSASHWEGLPIVILEALAAGLPIVATEVGDIPEVVVAGTGILVPSRSPYQLAATINSLISDPAKTKQLGDNAKAHVIENYHPKIWTNRIMKIYREVIG